MLVSLIAIRPIRLINEKYIHLACIVEKLVLKIDGCAESYLNFN